MSQPRRASVKRNEVGKFFRPSLITILQCPFPIDAPFKVKECMR